MRIGEGNVLGIVVFVLLLFTAVSAQRVEDPLDRPAALAPDPAHCVLLDITTAGGRLVAVGERGITILSDDGGKTWRQAKVPTSESLTAVKFPTAKSGWAVGHSGVVLHTEDAGESWTRQLDGRVAARLVLEAAQSNVERAGQSGPGAEKAKKRLADAEVLVKDGPDKPLLALHFDNEQSGLVVGAYGLIFGTEDGGKTWKPWMDRLDNPTGNHIYAIAVKDKAIYLAGERGFFARSLDGGATFTTIETPYKGTYFNVAVTAAAGRVVLAGMRGNVYWSADQGRLFNKAAVPIPVNMSVTTLLADGRLLFANQAGQLLESRDQGQTLQPLPIPPLPPVAGMKELGRGMLMTVGVAGVIPLPLGATGADANPGGGQ